MPVRLVYWSKKIGYPGSTVPGCGVKPEETTGAAALGSVRVSDDVPGVTSVNVSVPGSGAVVHVTSAAATLPSSTCRCQVPLTKEYSMMTEARRGEASTVIASL